VDRAPASAGPRRLAPLRARPALGVSVGEQQSHYCDTEQNKTDRAHGSSPSPSFRAANAKGEAATPPSKPMNSRRCISMTPRPKDYAEYSRWKPCLAAKAGRSCPVGVKPVVRWSSTRIQLRPQTGHLCVNKYTP